MKSYIVRPETIKLPNKSKEIFRGIVTKEFLDKVPQVPKMKTKINK